MDKQKIIENTVAFIKQKLTGEGSGHDWWHILRVWGNAKNIGSHEKADMFIIELSAILHDIADWKFHDGDENIGPKMAADWLKKQGVEEIIISRIKTIIKEISFKGSEVESTITSIEAKIVQDADRLDAIGAIGIARAFAYGGFKMRELYNPEISPELHSSFESYQKNSSPTINHFYEKLLLLTDRMNTVTAKKIAQNRHGFMELYLKQFFNEWNGFI